MICVLCPDEHLHVCNCGHLHADHIFGGGCKIAKCDCERYDQTKLKDYKEYEPVYKKGLQR